MTKEEGITRVTEMMKKIGLDPDFIIELEYKRSQEYLKILIHRTEQTLITLQEEDNMEVLSDRAKSVNNTLNQLIFAHNKMVEMQGIIYTLKQENDLLNERLKLRK